MNVDELEKSIDDDILNRIAALLHAEERLRGHPQLVNLRAIVMKELSQIDAAHGPEIKVESPAQDPIPPKPEGGKTSVSEERRL